MTILFMYVGDITSLLTEDKNKGTNNAEDWVNILQKIEPKEIVCQFEMILPQLKIISRKTSSGHFNLSAKSQSKCSSILYFVHINSCLLVLDTLRSASNCISCLTSDQYEAFLAFLIPQFCVHDMKVLQ